MMKKRLSKTLWYGFDVDSEGNPIIPSSAKSANDLEGLHYGELYIHLSDQITLWSVAKNGEVQQIAGGDKVDLSGYLLKSIWDKVWEIRTDPTGKEYIFGKLPVVTQYGITMYADGGNIDLPSLYAGLPIDGKTIYWDNGVLKALGGGGVAESVAWGNVTGKPSWITDAKPIYTYSEIQGTPDLTKYALKTDIPSLSGYATEQWVIGQNYVNSSSLANELKKYVSIDNDESINGLKNFKKGLQIDGLGISKSQDDVIYLDANLVVRGGITMYADNTVDIPSIIDSLPVASTTTKGIASFDGEYFSVSNGKVTLLEGNVGLNEEELAAYLSNNKYATQSWVQSLGYATSSDLDSRINALVNGAPAAYDTLKEIADVLAGNVDSIGDIITTLGTKWTQDNAKIANWDAAYSWGNHASVGYALKSYVDTEFAKYVTLATAQTISGEKNFTGGLKVNDSPIVYDATNKYWKLEGDLLVTGGVTMYGNEGTYTPSTIMDAILYDDATLGINSNGELYVKGGTGGGLDITALQNYLTTNSYLNVTGGDNRYLKRTGGVLSGALFIDTSSTSDNPLALRSKYADADGACRIQFVDNANKFQGYVMSGWGNLTMVHRSYKSITVGEKGIFCSTDNGVTQNTIWHSGNLTASSLGLGNVTNLAASAYLTALSSNTTNAVSITVGGTTKNITTYTMKSSLGLGSNAYTSTAYLPSASYTAADVLAKLKTVDGAGSGLDADTLDGIDSSSFARNQLMNNLLYSGNEFNFVPSAYSGMVWFNYQTQGGKNGNITTYHFANGSGDTNVTLNATSFTGNAASATKLQTARTIWGQSFDGTSNIAGAYLSDVTRILGSNNRGVFLQQHSVPTSLGSLGSAVTFGSVYSSYGTALWGTGDGNGHIQVGRFDGSNVAYNLCLQELGGKVGIRTTNPTHTLSVEGSVASVPALGYLKDSGFSVGYTGSFGIHLYTVSNGKGAIQCGREDGTATAYDLLLNPKGGNVVIGKDSSIYKLDIENNASADYDFHVYNSSTQCSIFIGKAGLWYGSPLTTGSIFRVAAGCKYNGGGGYDVFTVSAEGNVLSKGGVTMYSMRKLKNVVDERSLSLSELSTIKPTRFTWKDGRDNRLHIGGIADDIQQVLPEVVYKTSDGILTMDYGNASFAIASSLIKPVIDHEKRIAMLERENKELRNELERLKSA